MTDDDLDLIETEALIDALGRRKRAVLVVTLGDVNGKVGENSEGAVTYWRGGWMTAVGLARFAVHDILTSGTVRREIPEE